MWRRLTMSVVAQMTAKLAWPAISPTAMNCAEPAKTASDINWPCQRLSGLAVTSVPKMTPKGAAPTIIGMVSRAPAANSLKVLPGGAFKMSSFGSEDRAQRAAGACTFLRSRSRCVERRLPAPAPRRHAERALEMPREMTLIGESARRRDLGYRDPRAQRPERA